MGEGGYLCAMTLTRDIIDVVGRLYDMGLDDDEICWFVATMYLQNSMASAAENYMRFDSRRESNLKKFLLNCISNKCKIEKIP